MINKGTYIETLYNRGFHQKLEYLDLRKVNTTEWDNTMNKSNIFINNNYGKIKNNYKHVGNNNYRNKNRKRKIIWFNPLFGKLSNINIGKYFLNLIDKHFKRDNPLSKIFNRNAIKISYSFTYNISKIINNHNRKSIDIEIMIHINLQVIVELKNNASWMEIVT